MNKNALWTGATTKVPKPCYQKKRKFITHAPIGLITHFNMLCVCVVYPCHVQLQAHVHANAEYPNQMPNIRVRTEAN